MNTCNVTLGIIIIIIIMVIIINDSKIPSTETHFVPRVKFYPLLIPFHNILKGIPTSSNFALNYVASTHSLCSKNHAAHNYIHQFYSISAFMNTSSMIIMMQLIHIVMEL